MILWTDMRRPERVDGSVTRGAQPQVLNSLIAVVNRAV